MLDELEQALIALFKWRERTAIAIAEWLVTLIERIPEPARRYIPLKYERPDDYHTVEPELLQVQERPWHE